MNKINHSMLAPSAKPEIQAPLKMILSYAADLPKTESLKNSNQLYWNENHYALGHTEIFKSFSDSKRHETLFLLNQKTLALSFFIEKFGLNYGAQMILNAESEVEKSLYAVFGAEEVKHRLMLEPFIQAELPKTIEFHPLLPVLALALREANHESLVFTIQVVLEGFGLFHYNNLKESCLSQDLKDVFSLILKDEVQHHGMGVTLISNSELSFDTKKQITEITALIVKALIHAEWVMSTIEQQSDGFTLAQKNKFKEEISWETQIQRRIERLKNLMNKVGYAGLTEELDKLKVFQYKA